MKTDKKQQWINLLSTILSIGGIYLINSGLLPLSTAATLADQQKYNNLALPPGFIFSIWGVIYLGFAIYAIYQFLDNNKEQPALQRTRPWVSFSIVLNFLWILMVGFDLFIPPYFLQWLMLIISIVLLKKLAVNELSNQEKLLLSPFGLYAGWLTVAMIPFTSEILLTYGWEGEPFTPVFWAITIYIVAVIIVVLAYRSLKFVPYIFPLAWALFGLGLKFRGIVSTTAWALCVGLVLLMVYEITRRGNSAIDSQVK